MTKVIMTKTKVTIYGLNFAAGVGDEAIYLYGSKAARIDGLAELVKPEWDNDVLGELPGSNREIVATFFCHHDKRNFFEMFEQEVEVAI